MQNYLFNFVIQDNFWMICTFLFCQKKNSFLQLNSRYSKANNFSPSRSMACSRLSQNVFTFSKWPKARALTFLSEIIYSTLLTTNFFFLLQFSFINESMFNLFLSIKPNIQKFTLLIEKVTFQEKQYKI